MPKEKAGLGTRITSGPGYEMMIKMGWKEFKGLGAKIPGRIEPVFISKKKFDFAEVLDKDDNKIRVLKQYTEKKRIPLPHYEVYREEGKNPINYYTKVYVEDKWFECKESGTTKQKSKLAAATYCISIIKLQYA